MSTQTLALATVLAVSVTAAALSPIVATEPVAANAPSNDNIADAEDFGVPLVVQRAVNNVGATMEPGEMGSCYGGSTVWYKWLNAVPAPVDWEVNTFGVHFNTAIAAYVGSPGALRLMACNLDTPYPGYGFNSQIVFTAGPGETVYIQVGGFKGLQGDFVLNAWPSAAGPALNRLFQV